MIIKYISIKIASERCPKVSESVRKAKNVFRTLSDIKKASSDDKLLIISFVRFVRNVRRFFGIPSSGKIFFSK